MKSCAWRIVSLFFAVVVLSASADVAAAKTSSGNKNPDGWKERRSDHFLVYYRNTPVSFVDEVVRAAEADYRQLTADFGFSRFKGWTWENRARIFIYDSADDYGAATKLSWSAGQADPLSREIKTYPSAHGFFDSVLPHELAHIILREFIGAGYNVPLWFDEGAAMYAEKAQRFGVDAQVRKAMKSGQWMDINVLAQPGLKSSTSRARVDLFYAESASLFGFMIRTLEPYRFARLCHELKKGARFEWALNKAYMQFKTTADLEKAWKGYLDHGKNR